MGQVVTTIHSSDSMDTEEICQRSTTVLELNPSLTTVRFLPGNMFIFIGGCIGAVCQRYRSERLLDCYVRDEWFQVLIGLEAMIRCAVDDPHRQHLLLHGLESWDLLRFELQGIPTTLKNARRWASRGCAWYKCPLYQEAVFPSCEWEWYHCTKCITVSSIHTSIHIVSY